MHTNMSTHTNKDTSLYTLADSQISFWLTDLRKIMYLGIPSLLLHAIGNSLLIDLFYLEILWSVFLLGKTNILSWVREKTGAYELGR